jgi:drug/metabolite transporter (DMT)-like permease
VLGGFLALVAAVTFAFNNASVRRGVITGSIAQAMAITVPIGLPLFVLAALLAGSLGAVLEFSPQAMVALAAAGIVHFVFGRYCNFRATQAIGANLVGPLQQLSLVITLALAVLALGEELTPLRIAGIVLVVLGPMLTMRGDPEARKHVPLVRRICSSYQFAATSFRNCKSISRTRKHDVASAPLIPNFAQRLPRSDAKFGIGALATDQAETAAEKVGRAGLPRFELRYAEGIVFALLSSVGYGTSPILIRYGLASPDLGLGLAGGVISYAAATLVMLPLLFWPGWLRHVTSVEAEPAKWFTISGLMVCLSQMFLYMAFAVAPVSVASPIQRISMVFRIYFGWLLNRHHEVFGGKVYLGTAISLIGALALSLSTELVLTHVPLPDWAAAIARWHWP